MKEISSQRTVVRNRRVRYCDEDSGMRSTISESYHMKKKISNL